MDTAEEFKQNNAKIVENPPATTNTSDVKEESADCLEKSLEHSMAEDSSLQTESAQPSESSDISEKHIAEESFGNDNVMQGDVPKNVSSETQPVSEKQVATDNEIDIEQSQLEEKSDKLFEGEVSQNPDLGPDNAKEQEIAIVQPLPEIQCEASQNPDLGPGMGKQQEIAIEEPLPEIQCEVSQNLDLGPDMAKEQEIAIVQPLSELQCGSSKTDVLDVIQEASKTADPGLGKPNTFPDAEIAELQAEDQQYYQSVIKASGLSLLAAQYDTDSDSDEVCEVPTAQTYQNRFVEIDSDSDSSSSDVELLSGIRSPIDLEILGAGHGEEDDEENIRNSRSPKVKGEMHLEDLPPIQDLHITVPEEECTELGKIQSIIDQLVIVNSLPGTVPLDLDTVLFLEKGKQVLGEIFDVLGQVSDPLYCVRFNSNKEVREKGIEVGQVVYVAPRTQHTQFIVLANLMKVRGSDASWENDIEPPERHLDYSDDEEERTARRSIRNRNRPMDGDDEVPKRQRPGETCFPNRGGFPPQRPHRGNYYGPAGPQPHYQPPSNFNNAGNSWHSNYYQNCVHPQQQHQHYRMPVHPPGGYRPPPWNMPNRPAPTHPGLVLNPYAVFPPPQLMQQPLFPPPQQAPPPPPPPGGF